jgi:hypothetical protein
VLIVVGATSKKYDGTAMRMIDTPKSASQLANLFPDLCSIADAPTVNIAEPAATPEIF